MMKEFKKFIKQYPFFWRLQQRRYDRICEQHSRMSYAEIEANIGRKYEAMFGRKLNWDNPQTYNEKIHVSKLYMPSPLNGV